MKEITVQRANVLLTIPEDQQSEYLEKGYNVVDDKTGKVLIRAIPSDVNTLRAMVTELQKKLKILEEENKALKVSHVSKEEPIEKPEEAQESEPEEETAPEEKSEETEPVKGFTPINKRKPAKKTKE